MFAFCVWQMREKKHNKVLCSMLSPSNQLIRLLLILGSLGLASNCSNYSETRGSIISLFLKLWFIGFTAAASSQWWDTFTFLCEWPMLPVLSVWMTWRGQGREGVGEEGKLFLLGTELWFMSSAFCRDSFAVPKQVLSCMINVYQGTS